MGRLRKEAVVRKQTARGNPGIWFDRRKEILVSHKDRYIKAPRKGKKAVVAETVNAYLDEYPFHFSNPPDIPEGATEEERARIIDAAKDDARAEAGPQINTWLKNQATKENTVTKNPFRTFLAQSLKNLSATKPAHVPEHKMWMKQPEYRAVFEPIFQQRWAGMGLSSEHELTQRVQVAQDVYDKQDEEVKKHVRALVKEDYERRVALRESVWDGEEVTEESAELCRENITALVEPLLEELCRLCKLNVGTIMLARPPQDELDGFKCLSVDVGRTIPSEGGVKLPDFEHDKYCDLYLRWFMRFVVRTTETSAALAREEEEREKRAAESQLQPRVDTQSTERGSGAAPDPDADAGAVGRRRRGRRQQQRRKGGVDAQELSGDETAESDTGKEFDGSERSTSEDEEEESAPLAQIIKKTRQDRAQARREKEDIPVDEYGVPLRNIKGHKFSEHLRERLSRMAPARRILLLNDIDRMSEYELTRQETISKNECTLRAALLEDGLLTEGDPLWGDVVPQRVPTAASRVEGGNGGRASSASPSDGRQEEPAADEDECDPPRPRAPPPAPAKVPPQVDEVGRNAQPSSQERGAVLENSGRQGSAGALELASGRDEPVPDGQQSSGDDEEDTTNHGEDEHGATNLGDAGNSAEGGELVEKAAGAQYNENIGAPQKQVGGVSSAVDAPHEEQLDAPKSSRAIEQSGTSKAKGARARKATKVLSARTGEGGGAGVVAPVGGAASTASDRTHAQAGGKRGRDSKEERPKDIFAASRVGWLDWVSLGVDNLVLDDVAPDSEADKAWRRVVATWWVLQKHENFKKDRRVPANGCRPEEIGEWIKRARAATFLPQPPNGVPPEDFVDDWMAAMWRWWSSLNPQWRERNTDGKVSKGRSNVGDWSSMHYPGINGVLSVLKGVKWWFDFEGKPQGSRGWLELVEDVQWALDGVWDQLSNQGGKVQPSKRRKAK